MDVLSEESLSEFMAGEIPELGISGFRTHNIVVALYHNCSLAHDLFLMLEALVINL